MVLHSNHGCALRGGGPRRAPATASIITAFLLLKRLLRELPVVAVPSSLINGRCHGCVLPIKDSTARQFASESHASTLKAFPRLPRMAV